MFLGSSHTEPPEVGLDVYGTYGFEDFLVKDMMIYRETSLLSGQLGSPFSEATKDGCVFIVFIAWRSLSSAKGGALQTQTNF